MAPNRSTLMLAGKHIAKDDAAESHITNPLQYVKNNCKHNCVLTCSFYIKKYVVFSELRSEDSFSKILLDLIAHHFQSISSVSGNVFSTLL
jgi:hypothetical protein